MHPDPLRTLRALLAALAVLLVQAGLANAAPRSPGGAWLPAPQPSAARASQPIGVSRTLVAVRIGARELARISGGFCTNCSSGGGGGDGGTGSSGAPTESGGAYWETYRVTLDSVYDSPETLVNKIDNWSSVTINGTYDYTRTVVRDVQFSGGYADFVKASVGGEVSESYRTSVTYPIPPYTYGKLYVKDHTERRTYFGRQYQDFNDGTRTVVDSDSGPYLSTSTILGYVTGPL